MQYNICTSIHDLYYIDYILGLHQLVNKWIDFSCCKYIDACENTGDIHLYTHAYNSYEFHFKSVDELLIEFLIEQKANHEENRC